MVNRRRGEVEAVIGGERYRLCLTLGSLAELEHAFGVEDLSALAARFSTGRLRADDLVRLIGAGLRGGGQGIGDDEVRAMPVAGALPEFGRAVAERLEATFGGGDPPDPRVPQPA